MLTAPGVAVVLVFARPQCKNPRGACIVRAGGLRSRVGPTLYNKVIAELELVQTRDVISSRIPRNPGQASSSRLVATAGSSGKGSAAGVSKVLVVCVVTVVVSETVAGFWLVLGFVWLARVMVLTVAARVAVVAVVCCAVVFGALAGFPALVDTVIFASVWFRVTFLVSWPMAVARAAICSVLFTVAFLVCGPCAGFLILLAGVVLGAVRFVVVFVAFWVFAVVLAWVDVVAVVTVVAVVVASVVVILVVTAPGLAHRLKPGAGKQLPMSTSRFRGCMRALRLFILY